MNIVIPMVGLGKRFSDAGFKKPKPLIEVLNKTIVEHAIESLRIEGNYIFIIRTSNFSEELKVILKKIKPQCSIIEIDYLTDGSVSSILLAEKIINNNEELITTNCDQTTNWDSEDFVSFCRKDSVDGCVVTYPYDNILIGQKSPYSFIEVDDKKRGIKLEEKIAISDLALCGIHYWKRGSDFVSSAKELIINNDKVNNEFYVAKTYNYLIDKGNTITYYPLKKYQFFSLGTPEDVIKYEQYQKEKNRSCY